jgi:bisphosphoglycerate-independent phosphoglycerate mutase (AlkP superfamily)
MEMGYDSRIFVVEKSNGAAFEKHGKKYAEIIAKVEMCKFPDLRELFTKETDCYIYGDDGNTELLEDCYGDPLTEATIEEVIICLEKSEEKEHYRRATILLELLKSFNMNEWPDIAILHYGH